MAEVYLDNPGFITGAPKTVEELAEEGYIACDPGMLRAEGFDKARVMGGDDRARAFGLIPVGPEVDRIFYCNVFPRNAVKGPCPPEDSRYCMDGFMDYSCMEFLKEKEREGIPYTGICQKGCCGLLAAADLAKDKVALGKNRRILCVSDDILPENCLYEREREKMLFSDSVSYVEVTCRPGRYRIAETTEINLLGSGFFETAIRTEELIRTVCRDHAALSEIENILFPNYWRGTWDAVIRRLGIGCRYRPGTMGEMAHGMSSDVISTLQLYEKEGFVTPGKYQVFLSMGYGGHAYGMLVQRCEGEARAEED